MVEIYNKIPKTEKPKFSMPLSLRLIKECSQSNIKWENLHIADLLSIIYSIRIDNAKQYLKQKKQQKMQERGILNVETATEKDFDNL